MDDFFQFLSPSVTFSLLIKKLSKDAITKDEGNDNNDRTSHILSTQISEYNILWNWTIEVDIYRESCLDIKVETG